MKNENNLLQSFLLLKCLIFCFVLGYIKSVETEIISIILFFFLSFWSDLSVWSSFNLKQLCDDKKFFKSVYAKKGTIPRTLILINFYLKGIQRRTICLRIIQRNQFRRMKFYLLEWIECQMNSLTTWFIFALPFHIHMYVHYYV